MRILHTSDWHLGRSFGAVSLADDQQAFITWMTAEAVSRKVDLVVIAGDIFDRAIAPTEAVVMFREALRNLQAASITVAVITGNHDGADRVAAYDELMDSSRVYVRGGYAKVGEVISLQFADGPLDLVLLPFLDPQAAPDDLVDTSVIADDDDGADAFERRIRRTHHSVLAAAIHAAQPHLSAPRSLAVSHAFVTGGTASDSERQLAVGGTTTVDLALFDGFSYTALGHLHRPQPLAPTVRYSGTPLAYSFSEEHPKSVTIIEMGSTGVCSIAEVAIPVGRAVCTVQGTMDELLAAPLALSNTLVRAIITDPGVVLDAKQRLAAVYPFVVEIVLAPPVAEGVGASGAVLDRRVVSATEAADAFWRESIGEPPTPSQQALLHVAITDAEAKVA